MEDVMLDSFQDKAMMFDFSLHLLIGETFYIFLDYFGYIIIIIILWIFAFNTILIW